MAKLDIYCGLLGAGKTTLIRQLLKTAYCGRRAAIIENEIGAVNLDAQELRQARISVTELTSGCICCTVTGSFVQSMELLLAQENPEYIIIEPSGVADLSGILKACQSLKAVSVNRVVMIINAKKIAKLLTIIGEFFRDQVRLMDWIYLNFTESMTPEAISHAKELLLDINPKLQFIQTPLTDITAETFPENADEPSPDGQTVSLSGAAVLLPDGQSASLTGAVALSPNDTTAFSEDAFMTPLSNAPAQTTWSYHFKDVISTEALPLLKDYLKGPAARELWRVKGYLQLDSGVLCKTDYTFGEWFFEERDADTVSSDAINLLIFIGGNLPVQWLEQKMRQFEKIASPF